MLSIRRGFFIAVVIIPTVIILLSEIQHRQAHSDSFSLGSSVIKASLDDFSTDTRYLVDSNGTLSSNVSSLIDFAMIGLPMTGEERLVTAFRYHTQVETAGQLYGFARNQPAKVVKRLAMLPADKMTLHQGPLELHEPEAIGYYRQYWPEAKLMVGLRSPLQWFEALYNEHSSRLQEIKGMPHPNALIGNCVVSQNVCTNRAFVAWYLLRLGKRMDFGPMEQQVSEWYPNHRFDHQDVQALPNEVFVYEVGQLRDDNKPRYTRFRQQLCDFLGLKEPLKETPVPPKKAGSFDICQPEFLPLRKELLTLSQLSAKWIRTRFLSLPSVHSANRDHLDQLLQAWHKDPCPQSADLVSATEINRILSETLNKSSVDFDAMTASVALGPPGNYGLPALNSVLSTDHKKVIGDVQPFLQFAIMGFGKCGTSTLMYWLDNHPELQSLRREDWSLVGQDVPRLITSLSELRLNRKRVHKCPGEINQPDYVYNFYKEYFPKTKLFIGVRHPVDWFRSLYNFRIQNLEDYRAMAHPNHCIGVCMAIHRLVCTHRGFFGWYLLQFGKQHKKKMRPFTPVEEQIANFYPRRAVTPMDIKYIPNEIYLFDLKQLADTNETRMEQMRRDIKDFMGLDHDLDQVGHFVPGKQHNPLIQAEKDKHKIDICEDNYIPVRREMMQLSRLSAQWIRETFLDLPEVHVSNREHFEEILETWMHDPCGPKSDEMPEYAVMNIAADTKGTIGEILMRERMKNKTATS